MPKSRQTIQKTHLESITNNIKGLFTAEEFHKLALKKIPHIGIATVYRFLNENIREHKLHSYICDKKTIYSTNSNSHSHYTCQVCGEKTHIEIKDIGSIRKNIKGTICHFQIDVTGVCERCMKLKISNSKP